MTLPNDKAIKNILERVQHIKDIEVLWLYGSRARGTENEGSDYDLAIAFKDYIEDPVDRRLRPELLALQWKKELLIDLSIIDINQVPLPLAYTVVTDNSMLFSRNDYRLMIEEQKIMSKWELDHLYHRKCYD
jgi:predicted nucleotidyltransferase